MEILELRNTIFEMKICGVGSTEMKMTKERDSELEDKPMEIIYS